MTLFFRRFIGALVLDAGTFEDIEHDRGAGGQSALVVAAVSIAGAIAAMGLGLVDLEGVLIAAVIALGAWLVWAGTTAAVGTIALAEDETSSDLPEFLRRDRIRSRARSVHSPRRHPAGGADDCADGRTLDDCNVGGRHPPGVRLSRHRPCPRGVRRGWLVSVGILAIVAALLMETVN